MNSRLAKTAKSYVQRPFQRAVLRGLAVVLPPLLTIVILLWILSTVQEYVLLPIENRAKSLIVWSIDESLTEIPDGALMVDTTSNPQQQFSYEGKDFIRVADGQWIPVGVYQRVRQSKRLQLPQTSQEYYQRYVELTYLRRSIVLPVFFLIFILILFRALR